MTPEEVLTAVYNNCDPVKPATEQFYVDCTDVRGGSVFASKLCAELTQTQGRIHALFTGHIGCGKSSELQHFADRMSASTPYPGMKRFFLVIVDMLEYLDEYDVTATDLLLAVVAELAEALRNREGIELKDSYLTRRWEEVKQFLLSDVEISEGEISAPWGKAKVRRLRTDPLAREQVRGKLLPQTKGFLEEINTAFIQARKALNQIAPRDKGEGYTDFVLILDNLEKVYRFAGNDIGEPSQRALFIENAPQLTGLDAHVIYTVPLSLVRASGEQLRQRYLGGIFILPMIKTEERGRDHHPYESGRKRLEQLLGRRIPPGVALADVFAEDALDFLIANSGGHVRNLMLFLREATLYTEGKYPIPLKAAHKAIAQTVNILSTSVRSGDWEVLGELERSETQEWDSNDDRKKRLLEQLYVMEYINGGEDDPYNEPAPWYAVNPIVRQLRPFKRVLERLNTADTTPTDSR